MERKKVKQSCEGKGGDDEPNIMEIDRISVLPDSLIHHILSFLPTYYVVRMSILSKRWRRMWIYIPGLYFEEFKDVTFKKMVKSQRHMFFRFVSNCLKHRKLSMQYSADSTITRFKLDMHYNVQGKTSEKIDDWLSIAVQGNLKELDFRIRPYSRYYCLPRSVLDSRSLTLLKLGRLKLEISFPARLTSLKALCLDHMEFDDESLQHLISGCPIIEDLHLSFCSLGDINLAVSGTLRNLSLQYVGLTDQQLEGLVYGLPLLEKLSLCPSCNQKTICIHSHSLKSLLLRDTSIEAKIITPNLVCFVFEGSVKATISIDARNLLEGNLELRGHFLEMTSFFTLILFLSQFKCLKKMMLFFTWSYDSEQNLVIPENIRNICSPPLPNLKHLKVKIYNAVKGDSEEVRDSFLWCAPSVETLEIKKLPCPH